MSSIDWIARMEKEFGVVVAPTDDLTKALAYVRSRCQCSRNQFSTFIRWFFECYSIVAPKHPFQMIEAWPEYCAIDVDECIPSIIKVDRIERE